jgi:hypothetical protein
MTAKSRRQFIQQTALAGAASLAAGAATGSAPQPKALIHHVFFWLKEPGSVANRKKLAEGLETLRAIPTIQQLHIGYPASTEKRDVVDNSWDVSEVMFFADTAGQKVYQDHPVHQAFVQNYGHLWAKVIVYDAMNIDG